MVRNQKRHVSSDAAGMVFLKGLAPPRETGAEIALREGRQGLPEPITAGGCRRSSPCVADNSRVYYCY